MRFHFNFLVPVVAVAACITAAAQTPDYKNVGRTPTAQEIQAMDIAIGTDGKELPPGSGNAKTGARLVRTKSARPATAKARKAARRRPRSSAARARSLPCTPR